MITVKYLTVQLCSLCYIFIALKLSITKVTNTKHSYWHVKCYPH
nr:MAG TPA_asm: hypothetical protein [Caudoviricetes sp.]